MFNKKKASCGQERSIVFLYLAIRNGGGKILSNTDLAGRHTVEIDILRPGQEDDDTLFSTIRAGVVIIIICFTSSCRRTSIGHAGTETALNDPEAKVDGALLGEEAGRPTFPKHT